MLGLEEKRGVVIIDIDLLLEIVDIDLELGLELIEVKFRASQTQQHVILLLVL
tara:strand:+ start:11716 stop:11874 length:159 start_codon:yes stop_codon:yes gene_type:complete